jgi:transcriptional regulator with XRE-family HTH domain
MQKAHSVAERVGIAMRKRRVELEINQDDFAARIGMHRTQYSALERGEKNPTLPTLERICRGLQVKVSDLLREAGL